MSIFSRMKRSEDPAGETPEIARPPADGPDYKKAEVVTEAPAEAPTVVAETPGIPHYYISIRSKILVVCVGFPVMLLTILAAVLFGLFKGLSDKDHLKQQLFAQMRSMQIANQQSEQVVSTLASDQTRLTTTAEAVRSRINNLAGEIPGLTLEGVNPSISASERVLFRGMKDTSDGVRLTVKGTPFQLHQFFATLEKEFPSVAVMSSSITKPRDVLTVETTYLIPIYDPISR